ncbi:MAG: hypothetical protein DRN96_02110 [Thermoproteota archaeon]|nr:MAG: hypothetical protein DRN96_02110 [Candidatus Korarchaeota archaeon]RLG55331.1 MAG: hypothetical protein DRN99_02960 [Candidatus Korarchaeota archaeon]
MLSKFKASLAQGDSIIVEGPARVKVLKGIVEVFACPVGEGLELTVPLGKQAPVASVEGSELEVYSCSPPEHTKSNPIPESWRSLAEELAAQQKATCMVVGAPDSGKSSLTLFLSNTLAREGKTVGIVDSDIGQSDIGPPGVIGAAVLRAPAPSYSSISLLDGCFIGDKAPAGHLLQVVVGTYRMLDKCRQAGATHVIVNTSGMVYGGAARALKEAKIELIAPTHLAALEAQGELSHILKPIPKSVECIRLKVSEYARETGRSERIFLRESSMRKFLKDARRTTLNMDEVTLKQTILGTGRQLTEEDLSELRAQTRLSIQYAEESADYVLAVTDSGRAHERTMGGKPVKVVPRSAFSSLYIGLIGESTLLGVGILEHLDLARRTLAAKAALFKQGSISSVALGYLYLTEDGRELGRRKPGDF